MNANTAKMQSIIESTFVSAIEKLTKEGAGNLISDLYVQVDAENGELQIYDDGENLLEKVVIFDWINRKEDEAQIVKQATDSLKAILTILSTKGAFDAPNFIQPLSVSLTDDDFVVQEELLFLDEDIFRADDPLLKDLDNDLDDFLKNLLSDIK